MVRRGTGDPAVTSDGSTRSDAVRLALGTLTILPTSPPRTVDRRVGSWAMTLAPLVGALLAIVAGFVLWLLTGWGTTGQPALPTSPVGGQGFNLATQPFLAAALVIGLLAVLTRAMHLDGLADTADGLGSRKRSDEALEIMRRGDVGPFGVVTLVLVLLLQVLALGVLVTSGLGGQGLFLALVVSRLALPLACLEGIPAARKDGLGQVVAGSVARDQLVLSVLFAVVAVLVSWLVTPGLNGLTETVVVRALVVALVALLAGWLLTRAAVSRFGGVTGDVLGAVVETTFTTLLVVLSLSV